MAASSSPKAWFTSSGRISSVIAFLMGAASMFAALHLWEHASIVPDAAAVSEVTEPAAAAPAVIPPAPVETKHAKDIYAEQKYQRLGEYVARRFRVSLVQGWYTRARGTTHEGRCLT